MKERFEGTTLTEWPIQNSGVFKDSGRCLGPCYIDIDGREVYDFPGIVPNTGGMIDPSARSVVIYSNGKIALSELHCHPYNPYPIQPKPGWRCHIIEKETW